jgi:hypothetical protein
VRQQHKADDEATGDVSQHDLQKGHVGVVGEAGNADDSERASFGGDDRKRDRPPRDIASSKEVVAQGALAFAKVQPEQSNAEQVDGDDGEIEVREAHGLRPA